MSYPDWTVEQAKAMGGPRAAEIIEALLGREIRVTKQMIRDGWKSDCRHCPAALAITAVFPSAREVYADYEVIQIDGCVRFEVPENLQRMMRRFDVTRNRESMSGIRFTLSEVQRFYCEPVPAA